MFRKITQWFRTKVRRIGDWLSPPRWHHVVVAYDGSPSADKMRFYMDGELLLDQPLKKKRLPVCPHSIRFWFKQGSNGPSNPG